MVMESETKRLIHDWLPTNCERLLDAGCSWGDDTAFFQTKCKEVFGIDLNPIYIKKAERIHPGINFTNCGIEQTPFNTSFFDVVILSEVIEHVSDEHKALNEVYRILRKDGWLILTTPHKGMFKFLDPGSYKYYINKIISPLSDIFINATKHRHYSLNDIQKLLNDSNWREGYKIERIQRGGLFAGVVLNNIRVILKKMLGERVSRFIVKPFYFIAHWDNIINYGPLSYEMALLIQKI